MMRVELLQPDADLEFGNGDRCPDMRFGIGHYGTFDFADAESPARQIKLGFVGTDETIGSLIEWLEHLKLVTHVPGMSEEEPPPAADQDDEKNQEEETTWYEFHDLLKAKSLHLRTPLQYILPATYDESKLSAQRKLKNRE